MKMVSVLPIANLSTQEYSKDMALSIYHELEMK
jgi:hypothetical protein